MDETMAWRTAPALAAARRVESSSALDGAVDAVQSVVGPALADHPRVAGLLHGRLMGHALHPELTDLPIGFWTSAFVLDLCGGSRSRDVADAFVGLGTLCALPTAAAGFADWSSLDRRAQRVGVVHAALADVSIALYGVSWFLRRGRHRGAGVAVSMVAAGVITAGAYLGGHLALRLGAPPGGLVE